MSDKVGDLIQCLIENVVEDPDSVNVDEQQRRQGVQYVVKVAPNDVGRLIGKDGNVINAIRKVVDAADGEERAQVKVLTD